MEYLFWLYVMVGGVVCYRRTSYVFMINSIQEFCWIGSCKTTTSSSLSSSVWTVRAKKNQKMFISNNSIRIINLIIKYLLPMTRWPIAKSAGSKKLEIVPPPTTPRPTNLIPLKEAKLQKHPFPPNPVTCDNQEHCGIPSRERTIPLLLQLRHRHLD